MYSIIEQGGLQFTVTPGAVIRVPLLTAAAGSEITIDRVLLSVDGESMKVGSPTIKDALVTAKVVGHAKDDKVLIVKRKRRKDYRRKTGHRQPFTTLQIVSIKA